MVGKLSAMRNIGQADEAEFIAMAPNVPFAGNTSKRRVLQNIGECIGRFRDSLPYQFWSQSAELVRHCLQL